MPSLRGPTWGRGAAGSERQTGFWSGGERLQPAGLSQVLSQDPEQHPEVLLTQRHLGDGESVFCGVFFFFSDFFYNSIQLTNSK